MARGKSTKAHLRYCPFGHVVRSCSEPDNFWCRACDTYYRPINTFDTPEADEAWFQKAKVRLPAAQPRGTRDGSRALRGKTVYVVSIVGHDLAFTTRARAKAWAKRTTNCDYPFIFPVKIIK